MKKLLGPMVLGYRIMWEYLIFSKKFIKDSVPDIRYHEDCAPEELIFA
jgi:hypothetical protein